VRQPRRIHGSHGPGRINDVASVEAYHVELLAYDLGNLRSTPDGDVSLLDNVSIL
jgi:hypothetical protein